MHLHAHSQYSPLDGMGTPMQMALKAKSMNHKFICLTDHGNVFGWLPLFHACKEVGIKPGFGIEGYIRWDGIAGFGLDKDEKKNDTTSFAAQLRANESGQGNEGLPHITLIAFSQEGIGNISALLQQSSKAENRRKGRPTFDLSQLREFCKGVIVTTGCPTGIPSRLMCDNNFQYGGILPASRGTDEAVQFMRNIADLRSLGAYPVVEIVAQPGFIPSEIGFETLLDFADTHNLPCVLTADSHFVNSEDFSSQDLVLRIGTNNPYTEAKKIPIPEYQYLCTSQELLQRAEMMGMDSASARSCLNSSRAMDEIIGNLEISNGAFPKYTVVSGTATDELRSRCVRGVTDRSDGATRAERVIRLERELDVISRKGIADYFLIMSDLAEFVTRRGHIFLCRGSAGGSLVAFACGISQTDPMPHGLLFERFYDETRQEPPDIDIDMSPAARRIAVSFLAARYYTAKLLSLNVLTRKSAIIDTAHMLGIQRSEIELGLSACTDDLDDVLDMDLLPIEIVSLYAKYPKLELSEKLIHVPRHASKNAAGLIVSSAPIPVPCIYDGDDELIATVDKQWVDKLGMMKADLLSVRALGIIEAVMAKIGMGLDTLYSIDHNHPECNEILRYAMVRPAGIFQLDGAVLPILERIIAPKCNMFDEVTAANALARPGAMNYVTQYSKRQKVGHPVLDETFGVIVYQETAMKMCNGTSLDPNKLRKAISKSLNAEAKAMIEEHGGLGLTPDLLENILAHGRYSFNKSHCSTYVRVLLWMSYLKMKYPVQFLECFINYEFDQADVNMGMIRRLINEEIVRQPHSISILPLEICTKNQFFDYDGKTMAGSWLATGSSSKKYFAGGGYPNTPKRKLDADEARKLSLLHLVGQNYDSVEMLAMFPWVPTRTFDHIPLHTQSERFLEGEAILTFRKKLAQTKAMPYPVVQYVCESGNGLIYGKVSAKNYRLYRLILDTPVGTKVWIEFSTTKGRGSLASLYVQ